MRTPITLEEFLFTLNQDEDMRVHVINYENDERLYSGWKSSMYRDNHETKKYRDWFVQYFVLTSGGIEIIIVKLETNLD